METNFRPLHANELELLTKLLDHDFPGRDALRVQLLSVTGRQTGEHGFIELRTEEPMEANTEVRSPTEGRCEDIDGGMIVVMLHVKNGKLHMLEMFKEDGSEILKAPQAVALTVY